MGAFAFIVFTAMTVALFPFIVFESYKIIVNHKYHGEAYVYDIDPFLSCVKIGFVLFVYFLLVPTCMDGILGLLENVVFLLCLAGSIFITPVIIGIMRFHDTPMRQLADLEYQDYKVMKKIKDTKDMLENEQKAGTVEDCKMQDIQRETLSNLLTIHKNLQTQIYMHKMQLNGREFRELHKKTYEETSESLMYAKDITEILR